MTLSDDRKRTLMAAFRMPSVQGMLARKSSITNAYVNSIIPVIKPSAEEVDAALAILGMDVDHVRCVYCGDPSTEWDHLRPLVRDRQPTGFISEIANLVPACGKCNQSKGNKPWRDWMQSNAKWSPTGRGLPDVQQRMALIERYESWREPTRVDFAAIIGAAQWAEYWSLCDALVEDMRASQQVADEIKRKAMDHVRASA